MTVSNDPSKVIVFYLDAARYYSYRSVHVRSYIAESMAASLYDDMDMPLAYMAMSRTTWTYNAYFVAYKNASVWLTRDWVVCDRPAILNGISHHCNYMNLILKRKSNNGRSTQGHKYVTDRLTGRNGGTLTE
jgi:uncharacterized protein YbcV (DUF1398 family)